jgi:hypothetical protein
MTILAGFAFFPREYVAAPFPPSGCRRGHNEGVA